MIITRGRLIIEQDLKNRRFIIAKEGKGITVKSSLRCIEAFEEKNVDYFENLLDTYEQRKAELYKKQFETNREIWTIAEKVAKRLLKEYKEEIKEYIDTNK